MGRWFQAAVVLALAGAVPVWPAVTYAGQLPDDIHPVSRNRRPLDGVAEQDAALIRFGREMFGGHNVSAETYARAERAFGVQDLVDIVRLIGERAADAIVLQGFDQQLPEGVEPLLPLP